MTILGVGEQEGRNAETWRREGHGCWLWAASYLPDCLIMACKQSGKVGLPIVGLESRRDIWNSELAVVFPREESC